MLRRTTLLVAAGAVTFGVAGCGRDGPPVAVATGASSIPDTVEQEIRANAAAVAAVTPDDDDDAVELTVDDLPIASSVPPTTVARGSIVFEGGVFEGGVDDGGVALGPPPMPSSVAVIGDSIALSAEPYVTGALEGLGIDVVAYDARENLHTNRTRP